MRLYLGIDPAMTGTGMVLLNARARVLAKKRIVVSPGRGSTAEKIQAAVHDTDSRASLGLMSTRLSTEEKLTIEHAATYQGCLYLAIEQPLLRGYGALERAALYGAFLYRFDRWRSNWTTRIFEVAPKTLKKWATGNGSASKAEVRAAISREYAFADPSQDIVEAYALARIAYNIGEERLDSAERRVLKSAIGSAEEVSG